MINRAIFLDRDGVICERTPGEYVTQWKQFKWLPGAMAGIEMANKANYKVIIITNQGGPIAKGLAKPVTIYHLHQMIRGAAYRAGTHIHQIYICPHYPSGPDPRFAKDCECRKPKPGLLLRAVREWHIDPRASLMIGDEETDVEAGAAAGVPSILLQPGMRLDDLFGEIL